MPISTTAIGYICVAVVLATTVVSCNNGKGLSDPAAIALSQSCTAAGMVPYIRLGRDSITAECKPKETK